MTVDRVASETVRDSVDGLSYEFHGHPRYEPVEAYEEALEVFLERIEDVPGIVSVYESGPGVSVPGISDIDIVVVVEDDVEDPKSVRQGIENSKIDEYFFHHGPEVLTRSTFPDYYDVLPMPKEMELHYGTSLPYEKNPDVHNYLAYLVDQVNSTYPHEFLKFLYFPDVSLASRQFDILANDVLDLVYPRPLADRMPVKIDVRFGVHRLNSLRNDMELFMESSGRKRAELVAFDRAITDLRQGWFDRDRETAERDLLATLQDAITACFAFVDELAAYLADLGVAVDADAPFTRVVDTYPNKYRPKWEWTKAERDTVTYNRNKRVKAASLPAVCTVNKRLRDDDPVTAPDEYADTLVRRDRTKRRRDESMETYKYHPLRPQYMAVLRRLHRAKAAIVT